MVLPRRTIVQRAKAYDLNSDLDPPSAVRIFRVGKVKSSWVVRSENVTALSATSRAANSEPGWAKLEVLLSLSIGIDKCDCKYQPDKWEMQALSTESQA